MLQQEPGANPKAGTPTPNVNVGGVTGAEIARCIRYIRSKYGGPSL